MAGPAHDGPFVLHVCPNAALTALALGALVFVPLLETRGALVFLAAGLLLLLRHPLRAAGQSLRYWYVLILPAYCIVSTLWSTFPGITFRFGLQFLITSIVAVVIAANVSPRTFLRALFVIFGLAMAASAMAGNVRDDTGAWLGIFGSKNAFAGAVSTFLVLAAVTVGDRTAPRALRLAGLLAVPVGVVFLLRAQSAGAIILTLPVLAAVFLLFGARRLSEGQRLVVAAFGLAAGVLVLMAAYTFRDELFRLLLDTTGKDPTLTGRTDLWATAWSFIAERPVLGLGYQAFWVRGFGPAEAIWAEYDIEARSGFNFHNMYISNAVELGVLGVAMQVAILYGALGLSLLWALRSGRSEAVFAFAVTLLVVLTTFVEVPVFFQFSIRTVIMIAVLVYAIRAREHFLSRGHAIQASPEEARAQPLLLRP